MAQRDVHNGRYHRKGGLVCDRCKKKPAKLSENMFNGCDERMILCKKCEKTQAGLKALFG